MGPAQERRGRLRDEEPALRGCSERGVPVLFRDVLHRLRDEPVGGGVHEQVEAAELLGRRPDDGPRALDVGDVPMDAARRKHLPALQLEASGDRRPDSARSTGDQGAHEGNCKEL
jgi:hypothetical protein